MKIFLGARARRWTSRGKEVGEILAMMETVYSSLPSSMVFRLGTPTTFSLLRSEKELDRP